MHFIKPGDTITLTAPAGGVVAGTCILIGKLLVMSKTTADAGEEFEGARTGVYEAAPKATGQSWSEGDKLYFDGTNDVFTTTATGNTAVGAAVSNQAAGDTVGTVMLNGAVL